MTEQQQYRLIADRAVIGDKIDFETWDTGDLLVYQYPGRGNHPGELVRIERLVPIADEGEPMPVTLPVSPGDLETSADALRDALRDQPRDIIRSELGTAARRLDMAAEFLRQTFDHQPSPHPPTRDQIAEAIEQDERVKTWHAIWAYVCESHPQSIDDERTAEQYVLALIQNGADR